MTNLFTDYFIMSAFYGLVQLTAARYLEMFFWAKQDPCYMLEM